MITIRESLLQGVHQLRAYSDTSQIDAETLLTFVLKKTRVYLYTYPEHLLSDNDAQLFQSLLDQRQAGCPIAYLIGQRAFWTFTLQVSPAVLIPRPETELLVEQALTLLTHTPSPHLLELGTGSGAIALAIASERPDCQILATDISQEALEVAQSNARSLHIHQVHFCQSDWFSALAPNTLFHMILSNPPYLEEADPHLTQGDLRFEPKHALISQHNGLAALQHIIQTAPSYLHPLGWLCVEHGYTQQAAVQLCFKQAGYQAVQTYLDIQGHGRVTVGALKRHPLKKNIMVLI